MKKNYFLLQYNLFAKIIIFAQKNEKGNCRTTKM